MQALSETEKVDEDDSEVNRLCFDGHGGASKSIDSLWVLTKTTVEIWVGSDIRSKIVIKDEDGIASENEIKVRSEVKRCSVSGERAVGLIVDV